MREGERESEGERGEREREGERRSAGGRRGARSEERGGEACGGAWPERGVAKLKAAGEAHHGRSRDGRLRKTLPATAEALTATASSSLSSKASLSLSLSLSLSHFSTNSIQCNRYQSVLVVFNDMGFNDIQISSLMWQVPIYRHAQGARVRVLT